MNSVENWVAQAIGALTILLRGIYNLGLAVNRMPIPGDYLSFILIGMLIYHWSVRKNGEKFSARLALRYLFPVDMYRHQSSRIDYWAAPIYFGVGFLGLSVLTLTAEAVRSRLFGALGASPVSVTNGWVAVVVQASVLYLAADFMFYLQHFLHHKVHCLWRIHRAHHSAEMLTPIAELRAHPLEVLISLAFVGPGGGIVAGTLLYVGNMRMNVAAIAAVAVINLIFGVMRPFRHSHVWISYGRIGNHIFTSPCMHQIHHSVLVRHRDKNLGLTLALWDYLFGTLYVPESRESFLLGISSEEIGAGNPHKSLAQFLIEPVRTSMQVMWSLQRYPRSAEHRDSPCHTEHTDAGLTDEVPRRK